MHVWGIPPGKFVFTEMHEEKGCMNLKEARFQGKTYLVLGQDSLLSLGRIEFLDSFVCGEPRVYIRSFV